MAFPSRALVPRSSQKTSLPSVPELSSLHLGVVIICLPRQGPTDQWGQSQAHPLGSSKADYNPFLSWLQASIPRDTWLSPPLATPSRARLVYPLVILRPGPSPRLPSGLQSDCLSCRPQGPCPSSLLSRVSFQLPFVKGGIRTFSFPRQPWALTSPQGVLPCLPRGSWSHACP